MEQQNETKRRRRNPLKALWRCRKLILAGLGIAAAAIAGTIGLQNVLSMENKTTRIGFEDIGELATQVAYCMEVNVLEASRDLFGFTIPFTQSKYIYSYDVEIKAGFDFGEITWTQGEGFIRVALPEAEILSSRVLLDSFQLYHEAESIFRPITLDENNDAMRELEQQAMEDAVANGLLENARSSAELILTGFFANVYDPEDYEIIFTDA